jgi:hypothetical protein
MTGGRVIFVGAVHEAVPAPGARLILLSSFFLLQTA